MEEWKRLGHLKEEIKRHASDGVEFFFSFFWKCVMRAKSSLLGQGEA